MEETPKKSYVSFDTLKPSFRGEIDTTDATLAQYSHDASLFTVRPRVVVFPLDADDVKTLVHWVNKNRSADPTLSITARSAGTDMSGGSIGSSIIVDFTRHMNRIGEINSSYGVVEPGCFYRDFEKATLKIDHIMPAYPASREVCAVGGMVGNNAGGEKSLKYGKVENHIKQLRVVFRDGNEYVVKPLTKAELEIKAAQKDLEGELYRELWELIEKHYGLIMSAKPKVSKNSAGYYLWNVYHRETGEFDLCRLIVGSQGTLGIVTEIMFKLELVHPLSNMLVIFLPSLDRISELVNTILPFGPDSLESYDDYSMKLAMKFFFDFFKRLGFWGAIKLGFQFLPDAWLTLMSGKLPKLILMVECAGNSQKEIHDKLVKIRDTVAHFGYKTHIARNSNEADKYWRIRRESFNLLRNHTKNLRTAPFIDDIVVGPEHLPAFLPRVQAAIAEYKLIYTLAGHPGDGNFHIIPLMNLSEPFSTKVILELSKKIYDLVNEYRGSITAEHNDGIIRTPYLPQMFGDNVVHLFQETKNIFDPENIFNPGKKVGGTFEDIKKAMGGI